jgi:hypothetical protein
MFNVLGLEVPIWLLAVVVVLVFALVAAPALVRYWLPTTEINPVHPGKKDTSVYPFDLQEVLANPAEPADTSSEVEPDERVAPLLEKVTVPVVEKALRQLSGEEPVTVAGQSVTIASRSTYYAGLDVAMKWVEEFYQRLGIPCERVEYTRRGKTYYNLVAEIKGKVTPEKVLIICSHLDSTAGYTWTSEPLAPGADDNGSGTIACLMAAQALSRLNLGCSVRFVHLSGEEQGLWGSYVYSDLVAKAKTQVVAVINLDMISYCVLPGNRLDIHDERDRNGSHELVVAFARVCARYGLNLKLMDTHNLAVQDRSDHAGFLDHGFKAVMISEEFTREGVSKYYHTTDDRISHINLPYYVEVVRLVIATAAELAEIQ